MKLPDVGEGVAEAELVEWLVDVGDDVTPDSTIAEVLTDKATVEISAPVAGTVAALVRLNPATCSPSACRPRRDRDRRRRPRRPSRRTPRATSNPRPGRDRAPPSPPLPVPRRRRRRRRRHHLRPVRTEPSRPPLPRCGRGPRTRHRSGQRSPGPGRTAGSCTPTSIGSPDQAGAVPRRRRGRQLPTTVRRSRFVASAARSPNG